MTFALSDLGNIGQIKWDIALCLLLSWTIVCLCLIKGIKSSGKVVYFSATFPYLLLITLMIYGLNQEGALKGVKRLFVIEKWTGEKSISDIQACLSFPLSTFVKTNFCSRFGGKRPSKCFSLSQSHGAASSCLEATTSSSTRSISRPPSSPLWTSSPPSLRASSYSPFWALKAMRPA